MPAGLALALLLAAADVPAPIRIEPADLGPGSPFIVRVTSPDATRVTGTVFGRPLTFVGTGGEWTAMGGVDLDDPVGEAPLQVDIERGSGKRSTARATLRVGARDYPTEELTVEEKYVEPPAEVSERIARETALLNETFGRVTPERLDKGRVTPPLPGVEGRNFGRRRVFNKQPRSPHSGADLSAPTGTPVVAAAAGRVVLAQELYFSGNMIVLEHGTGVFTMYAHLSAFEVAAGATVEPGQVIGRVGATGRVTGPHLHFGARIGAARVEPFALLKLLADAPAGRLHLRDRRPHQRLVRGARRRAGRWHSRPLASALRRPRCARPRRRSHEFRVPVLPGGDRVLRVLRGAPHRLREGAGVLLAPDLRAGAGRGPGPGPPDLPDLPEEQRVLGLVRHARARDDGTFAAVDRAGYDRASAAAATLRLAIAELPRCELCAVAMVTDSQCPRCRITYKDGRRLP